MDIEGDNIGYFDLAVDADAQLLFTCGYLDYSFKVTSFLSDVTLRGSNSIVQSIAQHRDVVRCLTLARDFGKRAFLVTGSNDCTVMVWEVRIVTWYRALSYDDGDDERLTTMID